MLNEDAEAWQRDLFPTLHFIILGLFRPRGVRYSNRLPYSIQRFRQHPDLSVKGTLRMGFLYNFISRLSIFGELWDFMRVRKKWWLGPLIIFLVVLGLFIVLTEGSALAPFIYTLF
jgi:hypothetical protein